MASEVDSLREEVARLRTGLEQIVALDCTFGRAGYECIDLGTVLKAKREMVSTARAALSTPPPDAAIPRSVEPPAASEAAIHISQIPTRMHSDEAWRRRVADLESRLAASEAAKGDK